MPISRRYSPEKDPHDVCVFGFDFSPLIPPGVGLTTPVSLTFFTNTVPPASTTDLTAGPVSIYDRTLYCEVQGGVAGRDYIFYWQANDTDGNNWARSALCLCGPTSKSAEVSYERDRNREIPSLRLRGRKTDRA